MKKYLSLFLLVSLVFLGTQISVFAQEASTTDTQSMEAASAEEAPAATEEADFSYGLVNKIDSAQLILDEYDYDTNQETSVTYFLTPETKIEGVEGISAIAVGDGAEVKYDDIEGKKTAKGITIEKQSLEGEINMEEDVLDEGASEAKEIAAEMKEDTAETKETNAEIKEDATGIKETPVQEEIKIQ